MKTAILMTALLAAYATTTLQAATPETAKMAIVEMKALQGSGIRGTIKLIEKKEGLQVEGEIAGFFPKSTHGFHIHEKGDCTALDGSGAGGHYNPMKHDHGAPDGHNSHLGDLGNIVSNEQGVAKISVFKQGATLGGEQGIIGRSIIVHENADDLKTQPTGAAGSRIGCGVIGWQ